MERLFCNMISITCWLLLFLIGILAVPLLIIFQSLESCHFFFFCYGSPAERDSSLENISAQWVKRWENSRHQKKKKDKTNCCLKLRAQHAWCRQALKMKVTCKGNELESGELSHLGAWKQMVHFLLHTILPSLSFQQALKPLQFTALPIVLPPHPFSLFLSIFLTIAIHVSEAASVPGRSKSSGSVFSSDQRKLIDQQWVCWRKRSHYSRLFRNLSCAQGCKMKRKGYRGNIAESFP